MDDVSYAIDDLDKMNADAEKLIANYLLLTPLVQNGNNFNNQLNEGVLFAQPTAKKHLVRLWRWLRKWLRICLGTIICRTQC